MTQASSRKASHWRTVFGAPIAIAVLSLAGLLLALLVEGAARPVLSLIAAPLMVATPVLVCGWRYALTRADLNRRKAG
jgi:hypothetical protein